MGLTSSKGGRCRQVGPTGQRLKGGRSTVDRDHAGGPPPVHWTDGPDRPGGRSDGTAAARHGSARLQNRPAGHDNRRRRARSPAMAIGGAGSDGGRGTGLRHRPKATASAWREAAQTRERGRGRRGDPHRRVCRPERRMKVAATTQRCGGADGRRRHLRRELRRIRTATARDRMWRQAAALVASGAAAVGGTGERGEKRKRERGMQGSFIGAREGRTWPGNPPIWPATWGKREREWGVGIQIESHPFAGARAGENGGEGGDVGTWSGGVAWSREGGDADGFGGGCRRGAGG
uniref:Uncharacterized protein n=1 Tax=Oryza sativa subsp. japonica TaxID=39947 RepID=Q7EY48_ORYSJ|nr:hypothetical protein [Oryza sativa Japonica Group]BAD31605.1 hypothetical protein [Oryza sativa Japonica Group]